MAISVVQTATGTGNPPFSFGSAVTVGNTVILITPGYSTTGSAPSTGSVQLGGNNITGTVAFFNPGSNSGVNSTAGSGNVAYVCIWMLPNVQVSGQTAVDITFTAGNSGIGGVAWEVAGLGTSPSLDKSSSGSSQSATTADSGTTAAITAAPEIIVAGSMIFSGAGASSPSGFTVSNPTGDCWAGYQIATSSGGTYDWAQTSASTPWAAAIATVKGTAAAPPPVQVLVRAPWRPPPPGTAPAPQVLTGPLPAPPATLTGIVAAPGMPFRVPLLTVPQILGTAAGSTTQATASLSGSGSLTASPVIAETVTLSGSGTLTAATTTGTTAALSGQGALTALWTLNDTLALSGLGTLSVSSSAGSANLTGTGTLTAAPQLAGSVSLTGLGTLTAAPVQTLQAAAALTGLGTLTAAETLKAAITLMGLGTLGTVPPFGVARSTSAVTDPRDGTSSVTAKGTSTPGVR